jgi:hypothetical protein
MSNCTVKKPTNCVVKPITATVAGVPVEGLGAGGNEMGAEVRPAVGEVFTEFTIEDNGTGKCALKNVKIQVVGTLIATGTPAATAKYSGATAIYSPANGMEKLEIKGTGKPAEFSLATTVRAATKGVAENPLSGTTTT